MSGKCWGVDLKTGSAIIIVSSAALSLLVIYLCYGPSPNKEFYHDVLNKTRILPKNGSEWGEVDKFFDKRVVTGVALGKFLTCVVAILGIKSDKYRYISPYWMLDLAGLALLAVWIIMFTFCCSLTFLNMPNPLGQFSSESMAYMLLYLLGLLVFYTYTWMIVYNFYYYLKNVKSKYHVKLERERAERRNRSKSVENSAAAAPDEISCCEESVVVSENQDTFWTSHSQRTLEMETSTPIETMEISPLDKLPGAHLK